MTICRKCGKEIPDDQELCEDCQKMDANSGESYLDELMKSMGVFEEDVQEEPAADMEEEPDIPELTEEEEDIPELTEEELDIPEPIEEEQPAADNLPTDDDEDINELLNLLSKDYDEEDFDTDFDESQPEMNEEIQEEPLPEAEMSLFNDDEGAIFADDDNGASVDDVYQEALSAVEDLEEDDYEVVTEDDTPEENSSSDNAQDVLDMLALDAFGVDESEIPDSDEREENTEYSEKIETEESPKKIKKEKNSAKKKSPEESFWKRIFGNIITEQTAAEEAKERELEKVSAKEKAVLKEERKKRAAVEKEEKAQRAKEIKDRKAAQKAEQAAAKKAAQEEKKRKKAELEANEVVGKINPVGATIVMVFFGIICLIVLVGTNSFSYRSAVNEAEEKFEERDYQSAYEALAGVKVSESSEELEEKVRICMQLQKELNSYTNYYKLKMYLEALDSLMKGIRSYDANKEQADLYGIMSQYNELEGKLAEALYTEFGVSETQARAINEIESQEEYTAKLEEIIRNWHAEIQQEEE